VAKNKRKIQIIILILIFVVYFFIAARPIPRETVLSHRWTSSLLDDDLSIGEQSGSLVPFTLGARFGYVDSRGQFAVNRTRINDMYLSPNMWAEYSAELSDILINDIARNTEININNARGYPILLDDRVFILGSEQNSLSEIDDNGNILWTYEFGAPLTCIDAASGLVLTGSLDGVVEVFNSGGERIFYFEPGGSRYSVILGCAISRDGTYIGIVSGIDQQRFLLFERFGSAGGEYKIVYHEFLETGFRRPVRVLFIDEDRRIVFERAGGIGCYSIKSRRGMYIPLDGEIAAIDESGDQRFLFLITSHSVLDKKLIGIRFPQDRLFGVSRTPAVDSIFLKAPFKSEDIFLGRTRIFDSRIYGSRTEGSRAGSLRSSVIIGGGASLISFDLEEK